MRDKIGLILRIIERAERLVSLLKSSLMRYSSVIVITLLFLITSCADSNSNRNSKNPDQDTGTSPKTVSLQWSDTERVLGTGTTIRLAFNATSAGCRDSTGTLHFVWLSDGTLYYSRQPAGGGEWSTSILPELGPGMAGKPAMVALPDDTLVAAWSEVSSAGLFVADRDIVLIRSRDGGDTWGNPFSLENGGMTPEVALHASGSGTNVILVAAWVDESDSLVYISTWKGSGWNSDAWTVPVPVSSAEGMPHDVALGGNGSEVMVIFEDTRSGNEVIYYAQSLDGGLNFSTEEALRVSNISVSSDIRGGDPSVAFTPEGTIYLAWQYNSNVSIARSMDRGTTWTRINGPENGLFIRIVSTSNGYLGATWELFTGNVFDDTQKRIGLRLSFDGFISSEGPFAMPDSENRYGLTRSTLVFTDESLDLFWVDTNSSPQSLVHRTASITIQ